MATEAVLKYLTDTNRPYSCADVTVNLRGAFTKSAIQKALDALTESGKIKCKLYGKQKVYAALQIDNITEDDTEDYDTQLKIVTQDLLDKTNELKVSEVNLKNLTSTPTCESAKLKIEDKRSQIVALGNKLGTLQNSKDVISAEDKAAILHEHEKFLREYRKRKRICNDILEAVLEGYPKSKKNFLDELCIETDEMVDFKVMSN